MSEVQVIKASRDISNRNRSHLQKGLRVAPYCRVSTDSEDQLNSYKSQVEYYEKLVNEKEEWNLIDVYADEAITGTQTKNRLSFQKLISDCMNGDIDMIITKSITRFARNTVDTLKYVRMLKERGVAVFFEAENINTLTMNGELLLTILSSVAQQEVENISNNVKKGLKMKMSRGELTGNPECLGYDYDREKRVLYINEDEAIVVRYIFNRYIEGAGGKAIGRELESLGFKTKRGNSKWHESTVLGIIKNEKYKGDVLQGKTFTLDPISKRRLINFGEEDQFYSKGHHQAIISEEVFEKAQAIRDKRGVPRGLHQKGDPRKKFSRQYAFSSLLECGFCGSLLSRRNWHSGTKHGKIVWQCITFIRDGKKACPNSKAIPEVALEGAFVEGYNQLCHSNEDILEVFLKKVEEAISEVNVEKEFNKISNELNGLNRKMKNLVDMRLEDKIDKEIYSVKYDELANRINELSEEKEVLELSTQNESGLKKRLAEFRKLLQRDQVLKEFDRNVFESIVEKVVIGEEEDGVINPYRLVFVYKTGLTEGKDANKFKSQRKNAKQPYSKDSDNNDVMYLQDSNTTCRGDSFATTQIRLKIHDFKHFHRHTAFKVESGISQIKETR